MTLKYSRIERNGKKPPVPFYATDGAAGLDLTVFGEDVSISPNGHAVVKTGICVAIPDGHVGLIFVRSSLGVKRGITLSNSVGVIDSDYRGEIKVILINWGEEDFVIENGDRIAQMVIAKYERIAWEEAADLTETERGSGGFGHTGV